MAAPPARGRRRKFDPRLAQEPGDRLPIRSPRWPLTSAWLRAVRVPPRQVAGSSRAPPEYIAPEQVLDPVELDPRSADVYALAGTIFNLTTGRAFFDEIESLRDRFIAHMRRDPFEDGSRLRAYPAGR